PHTYPLSLHDALPISASRVSPPTLHVGLGTMSGGKRTEFAPSVHSQANRLPGRPCSTAATMMSASPIVEMRAAMGGARRRRRGRDRKSTRLNSSHDQI